jgi:hypothetical protein
MRFKRAPGQILGSKLFTRRDVNARLTADRAMDRGEFLGRLWAQFGPASTRHGGFEYYLRDRETNLDFIAYSGPHGPTYGGDPEQRHLLLRVVEAFEELLEHTKPVDCAMEYVAEADYGGGKWVVGCKDGRSFDVPDRRNRKASNQTERRAVRAR